MTEEQMTADEQLPAEQPEAKPTEASAEPDPRDTIIEDLTKERDQLLRALAEAQNIVRRTKQQADTDKKYAAEGLALAIIPVLDSFERTLHAQQQGASAESLGDGIRATDKLLRKALESAGVKRIVSLGAPFDPSVHEALATVDNPDLDDETVVDEIEAGYQLHDRVVRPAKVRVSRKP